MEKRKLHHFARLERLLLLFFLGYQCKIVSSSEDELEIHRFALLDVVERNDCAYKRSCTPTGAAYAEEMCEIALDLFVLLSSTERRLCGNPREPSCQWVHFRRVCSFVCDATLWEREESLRLRQHRLPRTGTRSLSAILAPMREIGGQRLKDGYQRWKQGMRRHRLRRQLNPQLPQHHVQLQLNEQVPPIHPLLPGHLE